MAILMVFNAVRSFICLSVMKLCGALTRQAAGGPGDLQVEAAGVGVCIQQFSRKV